MTVTQVETAAVRYAREVRAALADLPESEVTELGEDLDGHLAEVEAELAEDASYDAFVARGDRRHPSTAPRRAGERSRSGGCSWSPCSRSPRSATRSSTSSATGSARSACPRSR